MKLYDDYSSLGPFILKISGCLDIYCKDPDARKKLEKSFGVKMTEVEENFLTDQLGPRLMFCTIDVDKCWAKTAERRRKEDEGQKKLLDKEKAEMEERGKKGSLTVVQLHCWRYIARLLEIDSKTT